jgi:hypothetical protein
LCAVALFGLAVVAVFAGDDASGATPFRLDLSQAFTTYAMTAKDRKWSDDLIGKFKHRGRVMHFVRTSLPLSIGDKVVKGAVYQALEKPNVFYVVEGDVMLQLGTRWPYSPGVAGFSMHAPKSRNFILCLNFNGGVPFLSSSPVQKGVVAWKGEEKRNRFSD